MAKSEEELSLLRKVNEESEKIGLKLNIEKWIGSKLGNEYDQAVYCHLADLTYMQSTSCEMLDWMKVTSHNQDCWYKYQQPQICR